MLDGEIVAGSSDKLQTKSDLFDPSRKSGR